jgi:hypothetical protein
MKRIIFTLFFIIFIPLLFSLVSSVEVTGTLGTNATAGITGNSVVTGDVITTTSTATTAATTTVTGGGGGGGGGGGTTNATTTAGTTTVGTTTSGTTSVGTTTSGTTAPTTVKSCGIENDKCGKGYLTCCSGLTCRGNKCAKPVKGLEITPTTGIIIGVAVVTIIVIISVIYLTVFKMKMIK